MDEANCTTVAERSGHEPHADRGGLEGAKGKDLPDRNPHPHGPLNPLRASGIPHLVPLSHRFFGFNRLLNLRILSLRSNLKPGHMRYPTKVMPALTGLTKSLQPYRSWMIFSMLLETSFQIACCSRIKLMIHLTQQHINVMHF